MTKEDEDRISELEDELEQMQKLQDANDFAIAEKDKTIEKLKAELARWKDGAGKSDYHSHG